MSDTTGFSSASMARAVSGLGSSSREEMGAGFAQGLASFGNIKAAVPITGFIDSGTTGAPSLLDDMMMSSLPCSSGFEVSSFEDAFNGVTNSKRDGNFHDKDGLTRDFLGLRAFSHKDFLNMAGFDPMNSSSTYGQHNQNQSPWQG